jgi:hypothetical protein
MVPGLAVAGRIEASLTVAASALGPFAGIPFP